MVHSQISGIIHKFRRAHTIHRIHTIEKAVAKPDGQELAKQFRSSFSLGKVCIGCTGSTADGSMCRRTIAVSVAVHWIEQQLNRRH